ncbi:MAG: AAA family ATPase [Rubrivivax sp.]|jgi:DNA-binding SARP family transcriptional activator|nr:AAA family ATPase [Rubrivivax sp.]
MPNLRLHGTPALVGPDDRAHPLSAREAALLAWLHAEGPTSRARLAGLLWPDGPEARARANLRQTLARLRRLAADLLDERAGSLCLHNGARVLAGDDTVLLDGIELAGAPELSAWIEVRRDAARRERQRSALVDGRNALDRGDLDGALAAADAALGVQPESEEAWRLRMEAFARRGDRASALAAWDDCRLALRSAFGVSPSAETEALGRSLLAGARAPAAAPRLLPPALRRPPQLVGREDTLDAVLRTLALGHGAVVAGPGGIGKSRLLAEAAARFEPALQVSARPGDRLAPGAVASRLVAAAIRRFDPVLDEITRADIARLLPPGRDDAPRPDLGSALEHRRVLASVARTMLACHARGMRLVVVDDLQFADDVSMEAVQVVIGGWLARPPASAAVPLFGARPEELPPSAAALLDLLASSRRGARFELQPLDAPALRRLLDDLALGVPAADLDALAPALHGRVGGNPAFALESLKALWLDGIAEWRPGDALPVPPSLQESVRLRLARLSPEALGLAQLAAVAQADFRPEMAAAMLGRPLLALAPLLAELEAAQVFQGGAFAHDLVAEAVSQSIPASLRPRMHANVAEDAMAAGASAAAIAHHLRAAGEARRAAEWQLRAASDARSRWLMAEAAEAYEAAAALLDADDERVAEALRAAAACRAAVAAAC